MYVGMGDARKSSFLCDGSIEKLFPLSRGLRIVTVQFTYTPIQCTWVWVMYGNLRFCGKVVCAGQRTENRDCTMTYTLIQCTWVRVNLRFCVTKSSILDRGLEIVTVRYTYIHMMYVGMKNVRTSSFLCNF